MFNYIKIHWYVLHLNESYASALIIWKISAYLLNVEIFHYIIIDIVSYEDSRGHHQKPYLGQVLEGQDLYS